MKIRLDSLKAYIDKAVQKAVNDVKKDFVKAMRADILTLQTYKLFEGEKDVYVERNEVLKIIDKYKAESEAAK